MHLLTTAKVWTKYSNIKKKTTPQSVSKLSFKNKKKHTKKTQQHLTQKSRLILQTLQTPLKDKQKPSWIVIKLSVHSTASLFIPKLRSADCIPIHRERRKTEEKIQRELHSTAMISDNWQCAMMNPS